MDMDQREHSVMVWGEPHIVSVYRKSETVYEAIGNYMCETICVNDQSEGAALKRWREAAAAHAHCGMIRHSLLVAAWTN
jgi:predicted transcriptional regulator